MHNRCEARVVPGKKIRTQGGEENQKARGKRAGSFGKRTGGPPGGAKKVKRSRLKSTKWYLSIWFVFICVAHFQLVTINMQFQHFFQMLLQIMAQIQIEIELQISSRMSLLNSLP